MKSQSMVLPFFAGLFLALGTIVSACGGGEESSATPTPALEPTIPSQFTTYTDEEQLFSISYPSDWELMLSELPRVEEDVGELLELKESDSPLKDIVNIFLAGAMGEAAVTVIVEPLDVSTFDELAEVMARGTEALGLECTELARVEALAGGRRVLILGHECDMLDGSKQRGVEMYVIDDKTVWTVVCAASPEKFSSVEETCNQVVRSLRILR